MFIYPLNVLLWISVSCPLYFCWLEVLQNKICRLTDVSVALFFYAKSLNNRSKQTTTTQIRFHICLNSFVGVQRLNDWHSPGCHQCNHEKVSTCQFQGAWSKSWTLHICMETCFQKLLCRNLELCKHEHVSENYRCRNLYKTYYANVHTMRLRQI